MTKRRFLTIAILAPLAGACLPGAGISPYGRATTLYPVASPPVSGELLAVRADSLWLMRDSIPQAFSSADIKRVAVQRHTYNGKRTLIWMSVAGAATGLAMSAACASYHRSEGEGSGSCSGVLPGFFVAFLIPGSLFALTNEGSSKHRLSPAETELLRLYARFPQGLPDTLRNVKKPLVGERR